jgi:hypothetical protein
MHHLLLDEVRDDPMLVALDSRRAERWRQIHADAERARLIRNRRQVAAAREDAELERLQAFPRLALLGADWRAAQHGWLREILRRWANTFRRRRVASRQNSTKQRIQVPASLAVKQ